jgi:hypothetical protein
MANGLLDLLMQARESGRGARADLENSINYYIPPELRGLLGLAAEANPVVSMERAGQDAQRLVQPGLSGWDRMAAAGDMASNMAGVLAPMAAGRAVGMPAVRALEEGLLGMSMTPEAAALRQFGGDEFGGFTLYQGSPHNFSAERLVRMPDGSTQYVVGAPDVLPDVPAGAEVLRDFPLGRQRMDKIGTGEGNQAFGYGLYGAQNEGIARGYRDALSSANWERMTFDGMPVSKLPDALRKKLFYNFGGTTSIDDAVKMHRDGVARYLEEAGGDTTDPIYLEELKSLMFVEDAAKRLNSPPGSMYELNINADPADFLDWDKPLSEQPQVFSRLGMQPIRSYDKIFEEANNLMKAGDASAGRKNGWMDDPEISSRVNALQQELSQTPSDMSVQGLLMKIGGDTPNPQGFSADRAMVTATDKLREAGIPGIRYLDAGSRSTGGTSNFVIFDENLIDIVRKYGIAGAAAMLGASQADVAQAMQQQPPQGLLSGPQ